MSSILLRNSIFLMKNLQQSLPKLNSSIIRERSRAILPKPRLRNPIWFIRKKRNLHDDFVTTENRAFIKEIVHDRYGSPAIIKGVATYKTADQLPEPIILESGDGSLSSSKQSLMVNRRTGVIAKKIGQYPLWLKNGTKIRTTLLQVLDNHVVKYIPPEEYQPTQKPKVMNLKKFGCLLVGAESIDPSFLSKAYCGLFENSGVMPKKRLVRFLVSPSAALKPATPLSVSHFTVGDHVDVRGKTIDRGFQGVVKRHGFKGMPASHGVTKTHRRGGNIGGGGEKGRVWPGTKMPGHMGNRWRTSRGLKIWRINTRYNVMWVSGSGIPGETNSLVYVFDTMVPGKRNKLHVPVPTHYENDDNALADDIYCDEVHDFSAPTIQYQSE